MTTPFPETSMSFDWNSRDAWIGLSPRQRLYILTRLNEADMDEIGANWKVFSHDHQYPPDLALNGQRWLTWLIIGGRGAGKTRAGAEWIRAQALGIAPLAAEPASRIALVGELTFECAALWTVLVWGFRFGVLGVYISGRTREKVSAATGQDAPGIIERVVKAVVKKK